MLSKLKCSGSETRTPFGSSKPDFVLLPGQSGEKSETIWRESAASAFVIFAEAMQAPGRKPSGGTCVRRFARGPVGALSGSVAAECDCYQLNPIRSWPQHSQKMTISRPHRIMRGSHLRGFISHHSGGGLELRNKPEEMSPWSPGDTVTTTFIR